MDASTNSLNWFEIPATDLVRAKTFYQTVFGISMDEMTMDDNLMAFFPWTDSSGKANGAVVQSPQHKPSTEGTIVYLNGNPNLSTALDKVESAGGKVILPKTNIGENGNMAMFIDTEGNCIGLHSNE